MGKVALLHHLTMAEIFSRICAALLFVGLAGGLTAAFMTLLGDKSARYEKRLSFSPFNHVTVAGIFLAIGFQALWFRPLPFERQKRSFAPIAAVFLAMASILALIPLLDLIRSPLHAVLARNPGHFALACIENLQKISVNSVILGLIPLPGLWLGTFLPAALPRLEKRWRKGAGWGMSLAAILLILGWFPQTDALLKLFKLL